ncbi:MAG: hypothetical protein WCV84_00835 [Patescibacteria group bacterium]
MHDERNKFYLGTTAEKPGRYGLYNGRACEHPVCKNAEWYDGNGEYLGSGDLSAQDLVTIADHIRPDDAFIVVEPDPKDARHQPGFADLAERTQCLIRRAKIQLPRERTVRPDMLRGLASFFTVEQLPQSVFRVSLGIAMQGACCDSGSCIHCG